MCRGPCLPGVLVRGLKRIHYTEDEVGNMSIKSNTTRFSSRRIKLNEVFIVLFFIVDTAFYETKESQRKSSERKRVMALDSKDPSIKDQNGLT